MSKAIVKIMKYIDDYELVCGLEVHVELKTETKIFCSCPTKFGAEPNTQCCPVCSGMPGALPVLNRKVVELAVKAGLALNCSITEYSHEDRKNYFYPDLPKAYQISQYDRPLCTGGYVDILSDGTEKRIGITRIHIEEDAGKLIHDGDRTLIDMNRCGVPLIEIVSEPDIRSPAEAAELARKLRAILSAVGVSDCRMNEGSLRVDVNLSVRKRGEPFGTRCEIKNLNSFAFVEKAAEAEYKRQVELIKAGGIVVQETRRFDPSAKMTYSMRTKENANDYRYFPDPDLACIHVSPQEVEAIRRSMPMLPDERKKMYIERYGLTLKDAEQMVSEKNLYGFFDRSVEKTKYPKLLANFILCDVLSMTDGEINIQPDELSRTVDMFGDELINSSTAKKLVKLLFEAAERGEKINVERYINENELWQINDHDLLDGYIKEVIDEERGLVEAYKSGKNGAMKAIMGKLMAKTGGKANVKYISEAIYDFI